MIDIPHIIDLDLCPFLKKLDKKYSAELLSGTFWPTGRKVMEESGNQVLAWPATESMRLAEHWANPVQKY